MSYCHFLLEMGPNQQSKRKNLKKPTRHCTGPLLTFISFELHLLIFYLFLAGKWPDIKAKLDKGAFIYDVRCFWAFLTYLPTLIRYFTT